MKKNDIFLYGIYLLICICIILIPFDLSDKIDNNFVTIIINDIISFVKILVFFVLINIPKLQYQFVHFLSFLPKYQNLT